MTDNPRIERLDCASDSYPQVIKSAIKVPPVLYCQGNLDLLQKDAIGFCGSRKVSRLGLETTRAMASNAVCNQITVISGNAKGVDLAAHYSALEEDGETILVLPEGIDYFRIRAELKPVWDWRRALVISQFEPQARWQSWRAMKRNELVVGLSNAVIVVEAGEKGGTLNAGNTALKMGRPLFVADYENLPQNAIGNSMLSSRGGEKLTAGDNFTTRMTPAQSSMSF